MKSQLTRFERIQQILDAVGILVGFGWLMFFDRTPTQQMAIWSCMIILSIHYATFEIIDEIRKNKESPK